MFDFVNLDRGQQEQHYWEIKEIEDRELTIPYPIKTRPTETKLEDFTSSICQKIEQLNLGSSDWQNLSLLSLIIEKYGSFLSFTDEDIALVDLVRSTAAVAAALADNPEVSHFSLIAGDLSGIQNFIYTISSDGALKSLRARSFYLELVTEEIVQQLLNALQLPRTNVIYAGGGNLYILAAATEENQKAIIAVRHQLNQWLLKEFQGKVFLALDSHDFSIEDIASDRFADRWREATKKLAIHKAQKFADGDSINKLLDPTIAHTPCKVCHRDDEEKLEKLNKDSTVEACSTCREMFWLGGQLFRATAIVRSRNRQITDKDLELPISSSETIYYNFFKNSSEAIEVAKKLGSIKQVLLINNWKISDYRYSNTSPLLLGNYGQTSDEETNAYISASELAEKAKEDGIKRVGYLRMDVDNLGQIFARGLKEKQKQTLPRIAGLSRQMSYFFKVYLNSLAEKRNENFPDDTKYQKIELSKNKNRDNLLFIYAGGDDLFVSGSWNEIIEFSFDVYQCFRAYTGHHPDITISAGITLEVPKFPLYQAAERSREAEEAAKGNGRDSLGLFGQVFKWDEWLGNQDLSIDTIESKDRDYWQIITVKPKPPELLGILPIVLRLNAKQIGRDYARNFVRNLINLSNLQEQKLKEIEDKKITLNYKYEDKDIKYYLHLPKIAYTLGRLPRNVLEDDDFRKALKNPYNAPYYRAIATWIELLNR